MDYEKKYKEALERAEKIYKKIPDSVLGCALAGIFPELAEPEEEKTRKDLLNFLQSPFMKRNICDWKVAPWIDWLEKQGEKKSNKTEPKFKVGDIIRHKKQGFTCKIIAVDTEYRLSECNGTHLPFDSQDAYELVEQKPTQSEEDDIGFAYTLWAIKQARTIAKDENAIGNLWYAENWLKSHKKILKG